MSQPIPKPWTIAEFFAWQVHQTERYELVGGFPLRMTVGASNVHDDIVVNLIAELRNQLRGGPCRPFTGDGSLETVPGQITRPNAGVDCERRDRGVERPFKRLGRRLASFDPEETRILRAETKAGAL